MAVAAVVAAAARLVVRRVVAVERLVVRVVTVARHARVVQVVAVVAAHVVAAHLHRCSLHIYGAAVAPERNVLSSYVLQGELAVGRDGPSPYPSPVSQTTCPPAQCPEGRAKGAKGRPYTPITGRQTRRCPITSVKRAGLG